MTAGTNLRLAKTALTADDILAMAMRNNGTSMTCEQMIRRFHASGDEAAEIKGMKSPTDKTLRNRRTYLRNKIKETGLPVEAVATRDGKLYLIRTDIE